MLRRDLLISSLAGIITMALPGQVHKKFVVEELERTWDEEKQYVEWEVCYGGQLWYTIRLPKGATTLNDASFIHFESGTVSRWEPYGLD